MVAFSPYNQVLVTPKAISKIEQTNLCDEAWEPSRFEPPV